MLIFLPDSSENRSVDKRTNNLRFIHVIYQIVHVTGIDILVWPGHNIRKRRIS